MKKSGKVTKFNTPAPIGNETYSFDVVAPLTAQDRDSSANFNNSAVSILEIENKTNYLSQKYAEFSKHPRIVETDLVNFYLLLLKDAKNRDDIEKIITIDGTINDMLLTPTTANKYFDDYAQKYLYSKTPIKADNRLKKIVLNSKFSGYTDEVIAGMLPNYNNIMFYKQPSGEINRAISDTYSDNMFLELLSAVSRQKNKDVKSVDFIGWINNGILSSNKVIEDEDAFYISDAVGQSGIYDASVEGFKKTENGAFYLKLMSRVLLAKTQLAVGSAVKDYGTYSEVVGVKIVKKDAVNREVQTFIIRNDEKDLLSVIDSQIKPNKEYKYEFYYYIIASGSFIDSKKSSGPPPVRLFEIKLDVGQDQSLTQNAEPVGPPTTPAVYAVIFKDNKTKIRFNFQQTFDYYREKFITLQDSDADMLKRIQIWQAALQTRNLQSSVNINASSTTTSDKSQTNTAADLIADGKIWFGDNSKKPEMSDTKYGMVDHYEIFRTESEPFSYDSFYGMPYKILSTGVDSFEEQLEVNKKYYYIFRAVGKVGEIKSNPTPVYYVEMVENSSTIYPLVGIHDFKTTSGVQLARELKKYLLIDAAYRQKLVLSDDHDFSTAHPSSGPRFGDMWERQDLTKEGHEWIQNNTKYKIRLTSKNTGKKIDINFSTIVSPDDTLAIKPELPPRQL